MKQNIKIFSFLALHFFTWNYFLSISASNIGQSFHMNHVIQFKLWIWIKIYKFQEQSEIFQHYLLVRTFALRWNLMLKFLLFWSDVNECTANTDGCADTCVNTIGGFVCSCQPGFTLGADQKSCVGRFFDPLDAMLIIVPRHRCTKLSRSNISISVLSFEIKKNVSTC